LSEIEFFERIADFEPENGGSYYLIYESNGNRYAHNILNDTLVVNLPYSFERLEEDKE